jgi:quercetin dioxygenase-like cupin family protein
MADQTAPSAKRPWVVKAGDRPTLPILGKRMTVLADNHVTGGGEIIFGTGSEGTGEKPHSHPWDEALYVIEGQIDFIRPGEQAVALSAGDLSYAPGGVAHGFAVKSSQAKYLLVTSTGGAARLGADLAREVGDVPSVPKLMEVLKRHGVTPAPPPPST